MKILRLSGVVLLLATLVMSAEAAHWNEVTGQTNTGIKVELDTDSIVHVRDDVWQAWFRLDFSGEKPVRVQGPVILLYEFKCRTKQYRNPVVVHYPPGKAVERSDFPSAPFQDALARKSAGELLAVVCPKGK